MSLRVRLVGTSLLTLAIGLGALLAAGNALLRVGVLDQAHSLLRVRAQGEAAGLKVTPGGVTLRSGDRAHDLDRQSWILSGDRVLARPSGVPPWLDRAAVALGRARRPAFRDAGGDTRLLARPLHPEHGAPAVGAVVVGLSMNPYERLEGEVGVGSLALAALVLLGGFLVTRRAVDGALRPVAGMTASAEDWGAHDLDRRFALGEPRDELTGLAATLDGLLARIAASRRHEQRFASEVAHELRTPLAGLRARAELGLAAADEREAALRAVLDGAARLDATIDALLAVARRELDPAAGSVDLAALAREFDDVEISAPPTLPAAEGEPEVVRRALAPLVDNARRHARGSVRLELSARNGSVRLAVRDDGPGLDPALGERAFEPGVRGGDGDGAGLGLPLARRLARSCGGDVVAGPGPGGCFVLELPAIGAGR